MGGLPVKVFYVVLDGAADSPSSPRRTLEEADKPNIDSLAKRCACGMLYTVAPGVAPQSDVATLSLLGYDPERYYPGRGPLEALGAGVEVGEGGVAFRANFATVDPATRRIIDRRVGRSLTSFEARRLADAVDGLKLANGKALARFRATIGHRGVLVLTHEDYILSDEVSNTDPAYERRGRISVALERFEPFIRRAEPLSDRPEARLTAGLVNEFTDKAIEILDRHPVNIERERRGLPKANAILLRDAGRLSIKPPSFEAIHGVKGSSIAEMVVEKGIAAYVGLKDLSPGFDLESVDQRRRLIEEARLAAKAVYELGFDLVYVHLKGPDEPGHDGSFEGKVRAVEEIDRYFFATLMDSVEEDAAFIVTSDHATPWDRRAHTSDPVPVMVSWKEAPSGPGLFSESSCRKGGLGIIERGFKLLPLALKMLRAP